MMMMMFADCIFQPSSFILQNLSAPLRLGRPKQIWASKIYGMAVGIAEGFDMLGDLYSVTPLRGSQVHTLCLITPLAFPAHVSACTRRMNEKKKGLFCNWIRSNIVVFSFFIGLSTVPLFQSFDKALESNVSRILGPDGQTQLKGPRQSN